ncbi:MAG TPA: cytotoxic translational repressor of toxin-antitoxin stability system [Cyanobacteria bacterium UBA11372]|nr:cytotoxic translational repressor of toxin-antitoxin stability system [Cyanobacteria bacterium UBA11372]
MVNETKQSQSIGLDLRYTRSFLVDLRDLEFSDQERLFSLIFQKYRRLENIYDLPGLVKLNAEGTLYRCTIDNYTIGLELKGNIIKFWRVLPTPVI